MMIKRIILVSLLLINILSCEDVIEVELPTAEPRLVIDASINWFKGTDGSDQTIRLSLSTGYFEQEIPTATGAVVTVTDSENNVYNFVEETPGVYKNNAFVTVLNQTYRLDITYDGAHYTGEETMLPVSQIDSIEQTDNTGFTGNETEIKAFYQDPEGLGNYYFFEFMNPHLPLPDLDVYKDEFIDGNTSFGFYSDEDLSAGDILVIRNYGISQQFYEFMFVLLQQASEDSGGPFETQPATVRGNCINTTNPDHFPFGYFRVSEADEFVYVVE